VERLLEILPHLNRAFSPGRQVDHFYSHTTTGWEMTPLPQSRTELEEVFPRLLNVTLRYSDKPPFTADLGSGFHPNLWKFLIRSPGADTERESKTFCGIEIGPSGRFARARLWVDFYGAMSGEEIKHAFNTLTCLFNAALGHASPRFIPKMNDTFVWVADLPTFGLGWLTYVENPAVDVTAINWSPTILYPLKDGWVFQAPSDDPANDPDLFDKLVAVQRQVRQNGDIVRRSWAVYNNENPDELPPWPPDPEWMLE
jgi:hypothetical protein